MLNSQGNIARFFVFSHFFISHPEDEKGGRRGKLSMTESEPMKTDGGVVVDLN